MEDFKEMDFDDDQEESGENIEESFGIDPDAEYDYIPKSARKLPVEKQPVFRLRNMSAREIEDLQNKSINTMTNKKGDMITRVLSGTIALTTLIKGVKGWRNFKFRDGRDVPFRQNNGQASAKTFDYLPAHIKDELVETITQASNLSEQAEKNLESQSPEN